MWRTFFGIPSRHFQSDSVSFRIREPGAKSGQTGTHAFRCTQKPNRTNSQVLLGVSRELWAVTKGLQTHLQIDASTQSQGKHSATYEPYDLKFFGSWAAGVRPTQKSPRGSDGMLALRSHVLLPQAVRVRKQAGWAAGLLTPAVWVSRSKTLVGPTRFYADVGCRFFAEGSDTLKEVRRKNEQLRVQLNKTPWPDLKFFISNGRSYSLPLRAESRHLSQPPSEPMLAYLSGFFDGDGCVSCMLNLSGCLLSISQSFDQAEVLMLFYETFGGSITRQGSGMGLRKPCLQWTACGQSARNAAQLLMPHSITKRKQLLLAAQWPEAKSEREECKAELRALKKCDSAVARPCSWEY